MFGRATGRTSGTEFGEQFKRDAQGRLHDALGRFVAEARGHGDRAGRSYQVGFGRGFLSGLGGIFRPLGRSIPLVGAIGTILGQQLVGALKYAAIAGLVNLGFQMVNALAPAVGALALLPALIGTVVLGVVSLKLAFSGVGDALKAGLADDTAKFNEALKKLAPSAQEAVKAIMGLRGQARDLRLSFQQEFFAGTAQIIQQLGGVYLPALRNELIPIGISLNVVISRFRDMLAAPFVVANVTEAVHNMGEALANVAGFFPGFIQGMIVLTRVGASFLPALTSGFADAGQQFSFFINRVMASGQLEQFISGGLSVLGDLFMVLKDIGSIIVSLFVAANQAGGSLLGTLGTLTSGLAGFLRTAEGATALQKIFEGLAMVGDAFGQILQGALPIIGGILVTLVPLLGQILTTLAPALSQAFAAISPLLGVFDHVAGLAVAVAPLITVMAQLAGILGTGLASALAAIMPAVIALANALVAGLGPILPVITSLFQILAPILGQVAGLVAGILGPALAVIGRIIQALSPALNALVQILGTLLTAALQAIAPLFDALLPVIAKLATEVFPLLVPLIEQLGRSFLVLLPALVPIIEILAKLLMLVVQIAIPILKVLIPALTVWVGMMATVIGWIASFIGWLLRGITAVSTWRAVGDFFVNIWQMITEAFSAGWRRLTGLIESLVGWFLRLRQGAINHLVGLVLWVRSLPGQILNAIGNLAGLLIDKGRDVVRGLWEGVKGMAGWLRDKLIGWAKSAIPGPIAKVLGIFSPSKVGMQLGEQVPRGVAIGVERGIGIVSAASRKVAEAALPSLPVFGVPVAAAATGGAGTIPFAGGAAAGPTILHAVIQIGERQIAEIWREMVEGNPKVVAASSNEGNRQFGYAGGRR